MKLNQLTDSESRASKYALECLKTESLLGEAVQLLREAADYLRPGEPHDAAYKDFSRRFAAFLRATSSAKGSKK